MTAVQFHSEAEADLSEAAAFYESRLIGLGGQFTSQVERAVQLIRTQPEAGSLLGRKVRRVLVPGFPYSVIYRGDPKRVLIVAVAHQSRRPRYWGHRK